MAEKLKVEQLNSGPMKQNGRKCTYIYISDQMCWYKYMTLWQVLSV